MNNLRFTFYSYPGHGWLAVPAWVLRLSGVSGLISEYSYVKGTTIYLEEDCDAPRFIKALNDVGIHPLIVYKNSNNTSRIRSYNRFSYIAFSAAFPIR